MADEFDQDWEQDINPPYAKYALWMGLLSFAAVGIALYLQHFQGMEPCAWCTLQRLIFLLLGVLAIFAWLLGNSPAIARSLAGLAAVTGIAGVAAALYQHIVASASDSCALTLADKIISSLGLSKLMPWMFEATAMCDQANLPMLGIPFALWSAMLFVTLTLVLVIVVFSKGPLR